MRNNDEPIDVARLNPANGLVLISSPEGPLACRAAYGFGRVTLLAVDLEDPHISRWAGLRELTRRLFEFEDSQSRHAQQSAGRLTQTGVTELATQIGASQDEFPSVTRVTTWMVMGLLVGLLLVIGPVDYLLVHKVLKRPHLTWLTFPLFAIAGAGLAVWWGHSAKGDRLLLNQLDIVDVDAASGWSRSRSYGVFYSPDNRRYDVAGHADPLLVSDKAGKSEPTFRIAWNGRAENAFGGMYRTAGAEISHPAYSAGVGSHALSDVPVAIWSTKSLEGEWVGQGAQLVESQLTSRGPSNLGGSFQHYLPEPIDDWIVAFGHQVFRPQINLKTGKPFAIVPGIPWSPRNASQRELGGYLTGTTQKTVTGRSSKIEELKIEQVPYDPLSRDAIGVMQMLTFHSAAGGTSYTGLENGALRTFDFSPLLDLNRAVLVGHINRPMAHWDVNGKPLEPDQTSTFVRFVLPVRSAHDVSGD